MIRLQDDDTVNIAGTNNFEAWVDGNIGTYDVPLTDQGGDYYTVDFPATITNIDLANYRVTIYLQTGGSPAVGDWPISHAPVYWQDGEEIDEGTISISANTVLNVADETNLHTITYNNEDLAL